MFAICTNEIEREKHPDGKKDSHLIMERTTVETVHA